jgi:hypothetical protein
MAGRALETRMTSIHLEVDLNVDDMARSMTKREAIEFVKALDLAFADWDFTLALAKFFDEARAEHAAEEAEDNAKRRERMNGVAP